MNPWIKLGARAAAALFLASLVPVQAEAQASRTGIDRVLVERQRVFNNRRIEEELRRPAERREPQLALVQIKEDYVRIQEVNRDMVQAATAGGVLDLKFVAKSASEIRKRAERLKSNLALPEPEKTAEHPKAAAEAGPEELKASLLALGRLVALFVRNPIFREVNVVDARQSVKAGRELEQIIELSGRLKKDSERLDKVARN